MAYTDKFQTYCIIYLNIKAGTLLMLFRDGESFSQTWRCPSLEGHRFHRFNLSTAFMFS